MTTTIRYLPGNGQTYFINVKYLAIENMAGIAVDESGLCAFCHGDPCAEEAGASMIKRYYLDCAKEGYRPETCPMCKGRPS